MVVDVEFRDLQQVDLDALAWSGGRAHLRALAGFLERSWAGEVDALVAELPTGVLVAHGIVDFTRFGDAGHLQTLAVRDDWQGLGLGTAMVAALEERTVERSLAASTLTVELDNPRAKALYERLGFEVAGAVVEHWPLDDGRMHAADCELMRHALD